MSKEFCRSDNGSCSRCSPYDVQCGKRQPALLLGPQDNNADATLRRALDTGSIEYSTLGPIIVITDVRARLEQVAACLSQGMNRRTQLGIRAANAPAGVQTAEDALRSFLFAKPLTEFLETMAHEWVREALSDNWLFSVFHPIVDALTSEVFGYESLIRARNPETQQVYGAGPIIQSCEKLDIVHQLDQKSRRSAIACASKLDFAESTRIFINFLPDTIYNPEICLRTTMEAANEHNIPLQRLVFEVVETQKIADMEKLKLILDYYQDQGAKVAVDDMGAGFTSVEYLTALHPDFVKMDRDVVVKAAENDDDRRAFEQIVGLAHRLKIAVIAEGIETLAQLQVCRDAGVQYLQGFLFARPANPPERVTHPQLPAIRRAA